HRAPGQTREKSSALECQRARIRHDVVYNNACGSGAESPDKVARLVGHIPARSPFVRRSWRDSGNSDGCGSFYGFRACESDGGYEIVGGRRQLTAEDVTSERWRGCGYNDAYYDQGDHQFHKRKAGLL